MEALLLVFPIFSLKKLLLLCLRNGCIVLPGYLRSAPASAYASLLLSPYGATCIIHDVQNFMSSNCILEAANLCCTVHIYIYMMTGHGLPCAQKPWLKARLVMNAVHSAGVLDNDDVGKAQWCIALLWPM